MKEREHRSMKGRQKILLKRMNLTKCRATTKLGISAQAFREVKAEFLRSVIEVVTMEEIPPELIFNWDQTGLCLVPTSFWTMEKKGLKHVGMKGLEDKQQITAVFCGTLCGEFLPIQLSYPRKPKNVIHHTHFPVPGA